MPRQESLQTELKRLLRAHPETDVMELLIPDVTGVLRSKRVRRQDFDKTLKDGFSLPGGAVLLDTTGDVIEGIPWSADDGDPDVSARVVRGSLAPVPWAARPMAQAMFRFYSRDGEPFFAEARLDIGQAVLCAEDESGFCLARIAGWFHVLPLLTETTFPRNHLRARQTKLPLWTQPQPNRASGLDRDGHRSSSRCG